MFCSLFLLSFLGGTNCFSPLHHGLPFFFAWHVVDELIRIWEVVPLEGFPDGYG